MLAPDQVSPPQMFTVNAVEVVQIDCSIYILGETLYILHLTLQKDKECVAAVQLWVR